MIRRYIRSGVCRQHSEGGRFSLTLAPQARDGQAPGLNDTPLARSFDERHQSWRAALPKDSSDLCEALDAFDGDSRAALFAHCVSLSVNAVYEAWSRRPKAFAHADRLAQMVDLDLAASWTPTAANFLGRVTKARILQAVAEGRDRRTADRIEHLKKVEMATEAETETLLAGSGWLPEPLRTPGRVMAATAELIDSERGRAIEPSVEETAADGGESAKRLYIGQDRSGALQDADTCRRGLNAPARPVEQRDAEGILQSSDAAAHDGCFDPQHLACQPKAAVFRHQHGV